jgi:hypothetical protein
MSLWLKVCDPLRGVCVEFSPLVVALGARGRKGHKGRRGPKMFDLVFIIKELEKLSLSPAQSAGA